MILPGSKSTISELLWMRQQGLDTAIQSYAAKGGAVVGICGGYQLLGKQISDPDGIESRVSETDGLGLLDITTSFRAVKATHQARALVIGQTGWMEEANGKTVSGYEIHMGESTLHSGQPWLNVTQRSGEAVSVVDGAASNDGKIWGCYIHGIFENPDFRQAWLRSLGWQPSSTARALTPGRFLRPARRPSGKAPEHGYADRDHRAVKFFWFIFEFDDCIPVKARIQFINVNCYLKSFLIDLLLNTPFLPTTSPSSPFERGRNLITSQF